MRGVEQIPWLYDLYMSAADALGLGAWRRWLTDGAVGRTLEVGCGTGRNLPHYREGASVVALEIEPALLARARRRAPAVPLVLARAEALPFRDACVETVVSALVFCSVDDPQRGLSEIRRVLVPEGRLRMIEHVRSTVGWVARLQDHLQPAWTRITGGCRPNRETERAVAGAGFLLEADGRLARRSLRRFSARRG